MCHPERSPGTAGTESKDPYSYDAERKRCGSSASVPGYWDVVLTCGAAASAVLP